MKKVKIVNKNKFIKSSMILMIILCAILCFLSNKTYSNSEAGYKTEYVVKGETLWQIAEKEIQENQYFKNQDIRNVILEIKKVNHMNTSNLTEGMEIKIPIY